jgi:hypothetical protein
MCHVIVHVMHRNTARVAARTRRFTRRARVPQALAVFGIDTRGARGASPRGAAGAFCGELPVCAVGFISFGQKSKRGAGVGLRGGVTTKEFYG